MHRGLTWIGSLGLLAIGWNISGCAKASAQSSEGAQVGDRSLDLTVYKSDFAEVRDTRNVTLSGGSTHVELRDVSKALDPKSVIFEWPGQEGREVTSNTYDLGVGSGDGLLKRFVGHEVELVWRSNNGSEGQRLKGTLELADNGIVLKVGDKFYVNPDGTIIAPSGENLVTSPTLSADVQSGAPGEAKLRTTYLSHGMSWSADYVGTLSPDSDFMRLDCWASVTNRTGTDFPHAHITLVTGSPNVVMEPQVELMAAAPKAMAGDIGGFPGGRSNAYVKAPRSVGEMYSYEVKLPATIQQDQMTRVSMLSANRVPIKRDYSIALAPGTGDANRQTAQMAISFVNRTDSGLGKALPQGGIRVYEPSGDREVYIGGSSLGDVPKDDKVDLTLTDAIDVYSRSKVVKTQRIDKHRYVRSYHADLYNEKKKDISLRVVYQTDEVDKIVSQSIKGLRKDATTLEWKIVVPAGQHLPLDFSIQSRY